MPEPAGTRASGTVVKALSDPRAFEGKNAVVQHDSALQARRSALVGQLAMAGDEAGKAEAREVVAAFNEKNPTRRIQAMQLAQSVNQRQKRILKAQNGVYLPRAGRTRWRRGGSRCQIDRGSRPISLRQ